MQSRRTFPSSYSKLEVEPTVESGFWTSKLAHNPMGYPFMLAGQIEKELVALSCR